MSRTLVLRPPAKINLALHVGRRRDDGRHDVRTVLQSVGLSDTLKLTARPGPFALAVRSPGVPSDPSNLVWRAADALWRAAGRAGTPRGVHVQLSKVIPPAAGLGGGSADAAAALVGLNTLWGTRLPLQTLGRIAATLGADVPFFLQGGTAIGVGTGAELYPADDVRRLGVVLIKPSFGVATADAYGWLDADRAAGIGSTAAPVRLDVGWPLGPIELVNDLQPPVARRHPALAEVVSACQAQGALAALMTGSGSAVAALFPEAAARRAASRLGRPDWLVLLTRTLTRREARGRIRL